jgi:S1-C subfamily serine protease
MTLSPGRTRPWAIVLAALVVAIVGCSPLASPEQKTRSLERYSFRPVDGTPLAVYAARRSAILVRGAEPIHIIEEDRTRIFQFAGNGASQVSIGTAVALREGGYFLTAAHNLKADQPFYLAVRREHLDHLQIAPGQVVWTGAEQDDLALVWADLSGLSVFEWAPLKPVLPGLAVMSWGLEPSAGDILAEPMVVGDEHAIARYRIVHNAPLREGDSGGPVLDPQGRLIAVNIGRLWSLTGARSRALRPNHAKLDRRIERHRAQRRDKPQIVEAGASSR